MNRVHTLHTSDHARKAHYYIKYGGFRAHVWRDTPLPCSPVACILHYNNYGGESLMQWQMMKNQTTYMSRQTVWTAWISADVGVMFYIAKLHSLYIRHLSISVATTIQNSDQSPALHTMQQTRGWTLQGMSPLLLLELFTYAHSFSMHTT